MAVVVYDDNQYRRLVDHENRILSRYIDLFGEDPFEKVIHDDEGMDDNALSRLGLNVTPTPESQWYGDSVVGTVGTSRESNVGVLGVEGDAIITDITSVNNIMTDTITTIGMANLTHTTNTGIFDNFSNACINNLNVQNSLNFNGQDLIERIDRMERQLNQQDDEILRLNEKVRRLEENNGQDGAQR